MCDLEASKQFIWKLAMLSLMNKRGFETLVIVLTIATIVALVVGGIWYYMNQAPHNGNANQSYENRYLKISLLPGWTATSRADASSSVNIFEGNYILYINPLSGQVGGAPRFSEVAMGMSSVEAVLAKVDQPAQGEFCGQAEKRNITATLVLTDYYTDASQWAKYFPGSEDQCALPTDGKSAWFGSISYGPADKVFGRSIASGAFDQYLINFSYKTSDVNQLPKKGSPELDRVFNEVNTMLKTLTLTTDSSITRWKTYQNNQLGFAAKYPSSWAVNTKNGVVIFSLPSDAAGADKGGQPITIPVAIWVSTSSYTNLIDYKKNVDSLAKSNQGSMNYADLGYEQINGQNFFKDSWMHQSQGLDYVTATNSKLLDIQFRMDDTVLPFSQSASYKDFLAFLSSFQVTAK